MSLTERPKLGVGVFVWNLTHGRQILLGRRKGAHGEGTWSPPGGKPDGGESPIEAAARELREETGLLPRSLRPLDYWSYDRFERNDLHYVTVYFQSVWGGDPVELREPDKCEEWKWFSLSALPYPLFPGVQGALDWYQSQ